MTGTPHTLSAAVVLVLALSPTGCATLGQFAALRNVEFSYAEITSPEVAGIDLERIRSVEDLGVMDGARIAEALSRDELPMDFVLHLDADNPEGNGQATLVEMDWTLFVEDRRIVEGIFDRNLALPEGVSTDVPLTVRFDLLEFFRGGAQELVGTALAIAGVGGEPRELRVEALPTLRTRFGVYEYPSPVTIVRASVGR